MELSDLTAWLDVFRGKGAWITQVFLIVLATLLLNFVQRRLRLRLQRRLERTRTPWDDAVVEALGPPLTWLIWVVGIAFAATVVQRATGAAIFEAVGPVRDVAVVAIVVWFLLRLIRRAEANLIAAAEAQGRKVDRTTADAIGKLLRASVIITGALVALQTLGYSISGVLAFGGIGGLAVGFAAKDLLANFFGGLMIYLDRPFAVGDWIRSPDRDIEGVVERIGWRLTTIRTFDKRPLYVPNATFTQIAVENPSRMSNRRIYETIGIRYDDADRLEDILRDVRAMLESHPEIDHDQILMVYFNAFGPSSLDFFVYTFTKTTKWAEYHRVKEDVLLRIQRIIREHGAEIAYPTTTVHVPEGLRIHGMSPAEPTRPQPPAA